MFLNDIEYSIEGFSFIFNLKVLCYVKKIYTDRTFKSCTKYFIQNFTFLGRYKDSYVCFMFLIFLSSEIYMNFEDRIYMH